MNCKHEAPPYPEPGTVLSRPWVYPDRIVPCIHCGAPLDRGNGPVLDRDPREEGSTEPDAYVS